MIKLFRNIRQNLLNEGKTTRYFKYAIGEVVLVVIGILIALSINNWNERRKQQIVELEILDQLKKDIGHNIKDLQLNIKYQKILISSAQILIDHMKTDLPYNDSLGVHFSNSFLWTKFIVNSSGYENIKSRGVEIISNTELREAVLNLFEKSLKWSETTENTIIERAETMRTHYGYLFFLEVNSFSLDNTMQATAKVDALAYENIRSDKRLLFYLHSIMNDTKFHLNTITMNYEADHEKVLAMLEDEINKTSND